MERNVILFHAISQPGIQSIALYAEKLPLPTEHQAYWLFLRSIHRPLKELRTIYL